MNREELGEMAARMERGHTCSSPDCRLAVRLSPWARLAAIRDCPESTADEAFEAGCFADCEVTDE